MKEFFLILLFSKTILLTQNPVIISDSLILFPEEPLQAITAGARIEIDISSQVNLSDLGVLHHEKFDALKQIYPSGSLQAYLKTKDGTIIELKDRYFSISKNRVWIQLSSEKGVPTKIKFTEVKITSQIKLENINVYWVNYRQ